MDKTTPAQTNKEKLAEAVRLLREVNATWNEDEVEEYGSKLSFDELVTEVASVQLK